MSPSKEWKRRSSIVGLTRVRTHRKGVRRALRVTLHFGGARSLVSGLVRDRFQDSGPQTGSRRALGSDSQAATQPDACSSSMEGRASCPPPRIVGGCDEVIT